MSDGFFLDKHKQKHRGTLACKARWEAEDQRFNLDVILGKPEDLTAYQDCLAGARAEGLLMSIEERQRARVLSKNPK